VKYSHFEALALVLGTGAIIASVFVSPGNEPQAAEVTAQLLLIVVLAGALHWGRNGGFLTTLLAMAVYVAMRVPLLQSQGLSAEVVTLLVTRALTYAIVGVVGGELSARIKYVFARLENESLIDPQTGVYSTRYAADAIRSGVGQWERYTTEFSVVTITISECVFAALKAKRARQLMRQAADYIRNDIRMVDDLAAGTMGTFYVLLPRTDAVGATVVAERLSLAVRDVLSARDDAVSASVLSAAIDTQQLKNLADALNPAASEVTPPDAPADRRRAGDAAQEPVA
jgi:GGDEF domain-containing protein